MTNDTRELERQIEALVRTHLEACRAAAVAAVGRAFARADSESPRRQRRAKRITTTGKRRAPAELAALGERFYAAVRATPGETMLVLAPRIGVRAADLQVPVAQLKRNGLVRSVGQKHCTRYFPTGTNGTATKHALEVVEEHAR